MAWNPAHPSREVLLNREWLVTNGLGGYASGTVSGAITASSSPRCPRRSDAW